MSDRKVKIINMSNATVTLAFMNSNFKRVLRGEGSHLDIPFNILYDGLSEPGTDIMFTKGYLSIPNKQDRIDLGLEYEDSEETLENITMSSNSMLELLKEGNAVKIKSTLESLAPAQQRKMADVAISNGIYSPGVAALIKKYTGVDIAAAIADKDEISD